MRYIRSVLMFAEADDDDGKFCQGYGLYRDYFAAECAFPYSANFITCATMRKIRGWLAARDSARRVGRGRVARLGRP